MICHSARKRERGRSQKVLTTGFAPTHKIWESIKSPLHNQSTKLLSFLPAKVEQFQGKPDLNGYLEVTVLSDHFSFFRFYFLGTPELIHAKQMRFHNRLCYNSTPWGQTYSLNVTKVMVPSCQGKSVCCLGPCRKTCFKITLGNLRLITCAFLCFLPKRQLLRMLRKTSHSWLPRNLSIFSW